MQVTSTDNLNTRRLHGQGRSSRSSSTALMGRGGSKSNLSNTQNQQFRRYPTTEISRLPSFRGNPIPIPNPTTTRYPRLEELGRLQSFRQESLRKMGSIRNLETLRQGSFRQIDPKNFTEISHVSLSTSFAVPEEEDDERSARLCGASPPSPQDSYANSSYNGRIKSNELVPHRESTDAIEIEIAPGMYKRLKGSKETQAAWDDDRCVEAMCFICDCFLAVAPGCDSVICPICRSISPVLKNDGRSEAVHAESHDSWWLPLGDNDDAMGLGICIPEC